MRVVRVRLARRIERKTQSWRNVEQQQVSAAHITRPASVRRWSGMMAGGGRQPAGHDAVIITPLCVRLAAVGRSRRVLLPGSKSARDARVPRDTGFLLRFDSVPPRTTTVTE